MIKVPQITGESVIAIVQVMPEVRVVRVEKESRLFHATTTDIGMCC
jgi:hypothetical protein